jgi:predicted P-loop ATPase
MKKIILLLIFFIPTLFFAQSSRDINTIIQKTIDLHALKKYYSESEITGETPLIIINDDKIPNNLIVFKFNKRVKIMTPEQLKTFKSIYKGNLDSFFVFEIMEFKENEVTIKAVFRKTDKIAIDVNMKKEDKDWLVVASSAE